MILRTLGLAAAGLMLSAAIVAPALASQRPALVTFRVRVPDYTPEDAPVYIAGNIDALGPWDPGKVPLGKIGEGRYAITLLLPVGTKLQYKFTRGSWETVEKGEEFREIPDRELEVLGDVSVPIEIVNWRDRSDRRESHSIVGDFRVHLDFHATELDNDRTVIVYLPPGYDENPEARYPVLYMHDGQNLFDAASSFIGVEWSVDETVTRMVTEGLVEPLIVVGVYNTSRRDFEYTPAVDANRGGGGVALYADFIVNDLKPFIDANYRTRPGREHTGVMGSSFGGLASLYLGWKRSDVFSRVGAMSTSYWFADSYIIRMVEESPKPEGTRVWIDMGTAEGDPTDRDDDGVPNFINRHRTMRDLMVEKGFTYGRDLKYVEAEDAVHNERAWAARFPRALEFLFPAR